MNSYLKEICSVYQITVISAMKHVQFPYSLPESISQDHI